MIRSLVIHFSIVLGLVAMTGACSSVDPEAAIDEESIAEIDAALGEPGCGTVSCPVAGKCATVTLPALGAAGNTSPNASYGSATCPGQYVVKAAQPPTWGKIYLSMLFGEPLSQAQCPSARLEGALYAKINGVMTLIDTINAVGVWNSGCVLTAASPSPMISSNPGVTEVRAAGRAYVGATPKKVRLGFAHFN
jgi:hypothetical protein